MAVSDSRDRHFPGWGNKPRIETDGECLILKNVQLEDGAYDIKIWRRDAQGDIIGVSKDDPFLIDTILQVRQLAQHLFSSDGLADFQHKKVWFSDIGGTESCKIEDLTKKQDSGSSDVTQECKKLTELAKQIKETLFNQVGWGASLDGSDPTIKPTYSPPSREIEIEDEEEDEDEDYELPIAHSPCRLQPQKESELPEHIEKLLPEPIKEQSVPASPAAGDDVELEVEEEAEDVDATQGLHSQVSADPSRPAGKPQSIPTPQKYVEDLDRVLDSESELPALSGIRYSQLKNYSLHKNPPEYEKHYQNFINLLKNPKSTDKADQEMLEWLRERFREAYQHYCKQLEHVFHADREGFNTIEEWAKNRAATAVAGFILVKQTRIQKLVEELKDTPISSAPDV